MLSTRFLLAIRFAGALLFGLTEFDSAAQTWQWAAASGGSGTTSVRRSVTDAQGNTYVAGDFSGVATFGTTQLFAAGYLDAFVAKCSPTGQWLWAHRISTAGMDYAYGLAVDPSGAAYVGGGFGAGEAAGGNPTLVLGTSSFTAVQPGRCGGTPAMAYLAKLSSAGQWLCILTPLLTFCTYSLPAERPSARSPYTIGGECEGWIPPLTVAKRSASRTCLLVYTRS